MSSSLEYFLPLEWIGDRNGLIAAIGCVCITCIVMLMLRRSRRRRKKKISESASPPPPRTAPPPSPVRALSLEEKKKILSDCKTLIPKNSDSRQSDEASLPATSSKRVMKIMDNLSLSSVEEVSLLSDKELESVDTQLRENDATDKTNTSSKTTLRSPIRQHVDKELKKRRDLEEQSKVEGWPSIRRPSSSSRPVVLKIQKNSRPFQRPSMFVTERKSFASFDSDDLNVWSVNVAGYLSKCKSRMFAASDSTEPRLNTRRLFGAWQRRYFELPSAPCHYLRYYRNRRAFHTTKRNPKPDCVIDLGGVEDVKRRDDGITIDLILQNGGIYSLRANDGGRSDAARWFAALQARVRWLVDRRLRLEAPPGIEKMRGGSTKTEEAKLVDSAEEEEEEEEEKEEDHDDVVVIDPYVDSMTKEEQRAVQELKRRLGVDDDDEESVDNNNEDEEESTKICAPASNEPALGEVDSFRAAAEHMRSNKDLKLTREQKADLYGLYKQATEGTTTSPRPGMFDVVGRAKWDAWKRHQQMSKTEASSRYVALVQSLSPSWTPPKPPATKTSSTQASVTRSKRSSDATSKRSKKRPKIRPNDPVGCLDLRDDGRLLKYIRARNVDVDHAERFIRKAIDFRKTFHADRIFSDFKLHPILKRYAPGGHAPWAVDLEGAPVRYERVGQIDANILKFVPDWRHFVLYEMWKAEVMERAMRRLSTPTRPQRGVVVVQDLSGIGYAHCSRALLDVVKVVAFLLDQYYPENLKRAIVINAPRIFTWLWSIVKTFIAPETREKIKIVSGDPMPTLTKYISPKNIPAYINGGLRHDENGDKSCAGWGIKPGGKIPDPLPPEIQAEVAAFEKKEDFMLRNMPKDWKAWFKTKV